MLKSIQHGMQRRNGSPAIAQGIFLNRTLIGFSCAVGLWTTWTFVLAAWVLMFSCCLNTVLLVTPTPGYDPPHEFYGSLAPYHFDGVDISKKLTVGKGYLTAKAFGGFSFSQLMSNFSSQVALGLTVAGGKLAYENGNWNVRIGYAYALNNLELAPLQPLLTALNNPLVNSVWPGAQSLTQLISTTNKVLHFSSIGLAYDDGLWLAQMEGSYINSEQLTFPSVASGYFSGGRRFGKVTLYSLLGISESLNDQIKLSNPLLRFPEVVNIRNGVDQVLNSNGIDEKSVSLGLRWDVLENIALKAQWSHYWLGKNGATIWLTPESVSVPDTVNVWSVGMDFVF